MVRFSGVVTVQSASIVSNWLTLRYTIATQGAPLRTRCTIALQGR
jgi:hypothetical protein